MEFKNMCERVDYISALRKSPTSSSPSCAIGHLLENAVPIAKSCVWAVGKKKKMQQIPEINDFTHASLVLWPRAVSPPPQTTQFCHHHHHHKVSFLIRQRLAQRSVHAIRLAVPHGGIKITLLPSLRYRPFQEYSPWSDASPYIP